MEESTTPSEQELPAGAASIVGGIPIDESGNALVLDETTDDEPQPESTPDDEAEVTPEDNSTEPEVEVSQDTKDLLAWAAKKGIPAEEATPAVIKALELARQSEKNYHKGQQTQSELRKSLESGFKYDQAPEYDPYEDDSEAAPNPRGIDPRDLKIAMLDFQMNHKDYEQGSDLDMEMGKLVGENPTFWMNNLDQAYRIAKSSLSESGFEARLEEAKEEARREERERLTAKSKLSQPAQQATGKASGVQDFTKLTPQNIDAWLATQPSTTEYKKRLNEVNAVLASL